MGDIVTDSSMRWPLLATEHPVGHRAAFLVPEPHDRRGLLPLAFSRDEQGDVAADDFARGVSEQALCRRIPQRDAAVAIVTDDRVFG
jgi:hypothetical protein